jgi:hypothetical protein
MTVTSPQENAGQVCVRTVQVSSAQVYVHALPYISTTLHVTNKQVYS